MINSEVRRSQTYVGTGQVSQYTFPFRVFNADEVTVLHRAAGAESAETLDPSTYTVTLAPTTQQTVGGTVALATPLAKDDKLVIVSAIPYTQLLALQNQGAFNAEDLNKAWDKNTALIQQVRDELARAVLTPELGDETPEEFTASIFAARDEAVEKAAAAGQSASDAASSAANAEAGAAEARAAADEAVKAKDEINVTKDDVVGEAARQLTAIADAGTAQLNAVVGEGEAQVQRVTLTGNAQVQAVLTTSKTSLADITTAGTTARNAVITAGDKALEDIRAEGSAQTQAVETMGTTWNNTLGDTGREQVALIESTGKGYVDSTAANAAAARASEINAKTSETNAKTSETAAKASQTAAAGSAATATSQATNAANSAAAAKASQAAAAASQAAAKTSETNAAASATAAKTSETNAKTSETNAAASATAAKTSETNAKTSETNAAASATAAKASQTSAATSQTAAAGSATAAAASQAAAKTSETNAKTSETNAASSKTAAAASQTAAAGSATAAKTSETNAAASATAAKTSETNAKVSEEKAKGYATQASSGQMQADWLEADPTAKSYIKNLPTVDGVFAGGLSDVIHFARCSTAAAEPIKTVELANFIQVPGARILILFEQTNSAPVADLRIKVNDLDGFPVKWRGSNLPYPSVFTANSVYEFVFNGVLSPLGACFHVVGDFDRNIVYQQAASDAAEYPVLFKGVSGAAATTTNAKFAAAVSINPATGALTASSFKGALAGNATSATKLQTARTFTLTGDASATASFDGSANASMAVTVSHAANAAKLQTARTISLTGNATGSASFDGSANAAIAVTVSQAAAATTASKLGTADVGAATTPIYLKAGVATAGTPLAKVATSGAYADLSGGPDLTPYAKKTDVTTSLASYVTLTKLQTDLAAYAKKTDVPDVAALQTRVAALETSVKEIEDAFTTFCTEHGIT